MFVVLRDLRASRRAVSKSLGRRRHGFGSEHVDLACERLRGLAVGIGDGTRICDSFKPKAVRGTAYEIGLRGAVRGVGALEHPIQPDIPQAPELARRENEPHQRGETCIGFREGVFEIHASRDTERAPRVRSRLRRRAPFSRRALRSRLQATRFCSGNGARSRPS